MRKVMIALFLCFPFSAFAQAPIPDVLMNAKTAFIFNDGAWYKAYDKFYNEFKKWNRFEFVQEKERADIIIVLSNKPGELGVGIAGSNPIIGISESKFFLRITNARDGTPLWADYTGEAFLVSNSPKKLVSNLRNRMEKKNQKK
jgi:hypothetical protein